MSKGKLPKIRGTIWNIPIENVVDNYNIYPDQKIEKGLSLWSFKEKYKVMWVCQSTIFE